MEEFARQITVVIPTHFRHELLERSLRYYADSRLRLLVVDSTDVPFERAGEFSHLTYLHRPELNLTEKLSMAAEKVDTPFIVMRADNRHTTIRGILECVRFLSENPDYVSAQGGWANARETEGGITLAAQYHTDEMRGVPQDDPAERLVELFKPYIPTFYAVHRTVAWQAVAGLFNPLSNFNAMELLQAMGCITFGKHKSLPVFYALQHTLSRVSPKSSAYMGFDKAIQQEEYQPEYDYFLQSLAALLEHNGNYAEGLALAGAKASVASFIDNCCQHTPPRTFFQKLPKYLRRYKRALTPGGRQKHAEALHKQAMGAFEYYFTRFDAGSRADLKGVLQLIESPEDVNK